MKRVTYNTTRYRFTGFSFDPSGLKTDDTVVCVKLPGGFQRTERGHLFTFGEFPTDLRLWSTNDNWRGLKC